MSLLPPASKSNVYKSAYNNNEKGLYEELLAISGDALDQVE